MCIWLWHFRNDKIMSNERLTITCTRTAKARISAETDLIQLKRARQALEDMVPKKMSSTTVRIRNNAERGQGVAGFRWQGGEMLEIAPTDYARLVSANGFKLLIESGQLEVVA